MFLELEFLAEKRNLSTTIDEDKSNYRIKSERPPGFFSKKLPKKTNFAKIPTDPKNCSFMVSRNSYKLVYFFLNINRSRDL